MGLREFKRASVGVTFSVLSTFEEKIMDPALARPFITATKDVLSAMADLDVVAGTPYVKKNTMTCGLVSAMIGITGDRQGAFCVSFERDTAVHIVTQMLGEAIEDLMLDVQDAMGEITNMISGHARVGLVDMGLKLQGSTPSVIMGENLSISHGAASKAMVIPFSCEAGAFTLEFSLS